MPTIQLTLKDFKEKIHDFSDNSDWKFKGNKPAIIDFYADWCGPCKAVAPIFEELSNEYANDIVIYKVDTEAEPELSRAFNIQSIPSILFIPKDSRAPMMQRGALPKNVLDKVIREELLGQKPEPES